MMYQSYMYMHIQLKKSFLVNQIDHLTSGKFKKKILKDLHMPKFIVIATIFHANT